MWIIQCFIIINVIVDLFSNSGSKQGNAKGRGGGYMYITHVYIDTVSGQSGPHHSFNNRVRGTLLF